MVATIITSARYAEPLNEILLGYLEAAGVLPWPGVDGLTLDDVLSGYPGAAAEGLVPDRRILRAKYPELASEVDAFFGDQDSRAM